MANYYIEGLYEWFNYWDTWHKWAESKPSLKHPIKYLKWYFSDPRYRDDGSISRTLKRKENNYEYQNS